MSIPASLAINPGYRPIRNAFLLPQLGSAKTETRNAMGFKALDNLDVAFFAGRPLPARVVPKLLRRRDRAGGLGEGNGAEADAGKR